MRKEKEDYLESILDSMKAQFGNSVRGFWVYDGDFCPCCKANPIGEMMYEGQKALSVNAFMYRERGVLIAYFLCGKCGAEIMEKSKNGPTEMHQTIEKNLISAYLCHLN